MLSQNLAVRIGCRRPEGERPEDEKYDSRDHTDSGQDLSGPHPALRALMPSAMLGAFIKKLPATKSVAPA